MPARVRPNSAGLGALCLPGLAAFDSTRLNAALQIAPAGLLWLGAVQPPTRLFLMRASRHGVPVQAFHRLVKGTATMRVRLLGALTLVNARGDVMGRSECVFSYREFYMLDIELNVNAAEAPARGPAEA